MHYGCHMLPPVSNALGKARKHSGTLGQKWFVLAGATPAGSLMPVEMTIFAGECPPLPLNHSAGGWPHQPATHSSPSQVTCFSRKVATLRGCCGSNLWPPPRAKPPLPLHCTLICVHMQFWFYSYYTTPSVNRFFEALNGFKLKTCQLQSFITFWDLQLSCWEISIWGHLWILNFKFERFKLGFHWQYDFK
jgi:hypothetical protein